MNKKKLSKIKFIFWNVLPLFVQKFFLLIFYYGYYSEVKSFKYLKSEVTKINEKTYPLLHLSDGTKLVGYGPKKKFTQPTLMW